MPSRRISKWHYVYVLMSEKDRDFYVGYSIDLKRRLKEHNAKKNFSTKSKIPLQLVYVEAGLNQDDAERRENYFKTTQGRRFLKLRIRKFLGTLE